MEATTGRRISASPFFVAAGCVSAMENHRDNPPYIGQEIIYNVKTGEKRRKHEQYMKVDRNIEISMEFSEKEKINDKTGGNTNCVK